MVNQSIKLIALQIVSVVASFVTIFFIASKVDPEAYAVLGINAVIYSIIMVFSSTGLEMIAIRNVLNWKKNKQISLIRKTISQALFLRIVLSLILSIPMLFYVYYISEIKFDGMYKLYFILMVISAIFNAGKNSCSLLIKSFNNYFEAIFIEYSVSIFGRIGALIVYLFYGFEPFILVIVSLPIIVFVIALVRLGEWITVSEMFSFATIKLNLKDSWHFASTSYISYISNGLDRLIVTVLCPAEIIGSFSIGKTIYENLRIFIKNFYSPMIQKLVKYKGNMEMFGYKMNKIIKTHRVLYNFYILFSVVFILFINEIVVVLGLADYPYLSYFIGLSIVGQGVNILGRVRLESITYFYKPFFTLLVVTIGSVVSVAFMLYYAIFNVKLIFLYNVFANVSVFILVWYISKYKASELQFVDVK